MLRENRLGIFSNLILVMLMSSSICQTMYTSLFMTTKLSLTIFIAVVPITLMFCVVFKNKVTSIVSAIVVCILLILGLVVIIFKTGFTNAEIWLSSYSTWFIDVANGFYDTSYPVYTYLTLITLAFIITLFIYIFSIKYYNFHLISVMLFGVFFIQLQFQIFAANISFILFIFSFLLYYFFDILKRRSIESTYNVGNKLKYLIYIIPVCIVVICFSFLFPMKNSRIAMPWLDTKFDSVVDGIINHFSNKNLSNFDYFSIKATGFGENGRLGGNIKLSKNHVLNVKSEYSNLYLKASSKAFYDGHSWYDDNKQLTPLGTELTSYSDEIKSDSDEFINGNFMITETNKNDAIFKQAKAEISFKNLKTKSLFMPLKPTLLTFNNQVSLFSDNEQMLSTSKIQNNGFEYTVEYNALMLSSEEFKSIIRKSYKGYYNDYYDSKTQSNTTNDVHVILYNNGKEEDFYITIDHANTESSLAIKSSKDKAETIYRKYTQLPAEITPRVRKLAQDISKDEANTYDKAKAIELYLSKNYPYTLTPGNTPRKKDFVDYFLFDGKKGYCTYYASAMTVMLRCIDIPARYVEGYMLPPEADENGVFKVTNQQAHAWVEVYFEGFGWIPFEPTSPFVYNMYNDNTVSATISGDMLDPRYDAYLEMMEEYKDRYSNNNNNNFAIATSKESKTNSLLLVLIIVSAVVGTVLLAFGILVSINAFKFYRTLRRIRKGDPNSSVLLAYSYIIKILSIQNAVFKPGETPTQFGIRVEKTFDFKGYSFNKISFTKITSHYIYARYSKADLLKNDQLDMLYFIDILIRMLYEKMGKFRFVIAKYILGKI